MKKFFALILFFLSITAIYAQEQKVDVIIKSDGTKVEAIVTEVDVDVVKYKLANNPSGPIYTLRKNDIASILYSNGSSEVFPKQQASMSFNNDNQRNIPPMSGQALREYNGAKAMSIVGSVLLPVGAALVFTGLWVGLFADMTIGFIILMPVGGGLMIPGAVLAGVGNARKSQIQNDWERGLYTFKLGKNSKHPVNLALYSNGLSLKF